MTEFFFMAGLPRSGSTLLAALLSQRSDLYTPGLTNTPALLEAITSNMQKDESWQLGTNHRQYNCLMKGLLQTIYADVDEEYVVDKSRLWGIDRYIDILTQILGEEPKIIAPVRPLEEIVASYIRLCHANPDNFLDRGIKAGNIASQYRKSIDDARIDTLLLPNEHIGLSMLGLCGAYRPQTAHMYCVVSYNELIEHPVESLRKIETFLGLDPFNYDIENICGIKYNDAALGINDMHDVRPHIARRDPSPETVLSEYGLQRCRMEDFWTRRAVLERLPAVTIFD